MLARASSLQLIGVTTVYGNTLLRSRITRYVVDTLDQPQITVVTGSSTTLTNRPVWWAGHEGVGIPDLESVPADPAEGAVAYLIEQSRAHEGSLEIAAIGPLTNIARALVADSAFASRLKHLYIMGGAFDREKPEHNIKCDPEAARIVFESGIPMTVAGLDVTTRITWARPERDRIERSNGPLGPILADQLDTWWSFIKKPENHPHDPIAVLMATHPHLYNFQTGQIHVSLDDHGLAGTTFTPSPGGTTRVATDLDTNFMNDALLSAIGADA
jgi:purine nucleosidase